jgi:hypothetical protein
VRQARRQAKDLHHLWGHDSARAALIPKGVERTACG